MVEWAVIDMASIMRGFVALGGWVGLYQGGMTYDQ